MKGPGSLAVVRSERAADPGAVEALHAALDRTPGAWLGCDVESDALFSRHSMGVVDPLLAFVLEGATLEVRARRAPGPALLAIMATLAPFQRENGVLRIRVDRGAESGRDVPGLLRRFLALFPPEHAELGLYGALSFDYFRLGAGHVVPDDGRRRLVLYFADKVLVDDARGARWVEFGFPGLVAPATDEVVDRADPPAEIDALPAEPQGTHARRVARGVQRLATGELATLVLSQRFLFPAEVAPSVAFGLLRAHNPYPAMFTANLGGGEHLFGASPDLQVRADRVWMESAPVCGTLRRGVDPIEDSAQALALLGSPKEAAALAACADSDLNDKALVAEPGTAELVSHRRIHYFSTILHAIDHTRARRRADADAFEILLAHATPATVTGLPKADAVRVIEALESGWRNWYGGVVARVGVDGSLEAFTVLRAARVIGDMAEVRTGGNLLVDSDPHHEEAETELKAQTLRRVLRGEPPRGPTPAAPVRTPLGVQLVDLGDPWLARLRDVLARCAVSVEASSRIRILTAGFAASGQAPAHADFSPDGAVLALGGAAYALLRAEGARLTSFDVPRFARPSGLRPATGGYLAGQGPGQVGLYSACGIRSADLPPDWRVSASDDDGWVLAAEHECSARVALLFRPEVALSGARGAGERILRFTLEYLSR